MKQNLLARSSMVNSQLRTGEVIDVGIIDAFMSIPREWFVPETLRGSAYVDEEIQIAPGRYLLEPKTFGKMIEIAKISPEDTVLDVAAGSGYSSAILAKLAARVVALEEIRDLSEKSKILHKTLGLLNIETVMAPITNGAPAFGPYQVICIEGAIQYIPPSLSDQLAEGGRIVAIENVSTNAVGSSGLGNVVTYTKVHNRLFKQLHFDASAPLLGAFKKKQSFVF